MLDIYLHKKFLQFLSLHFYIKQQSEHFSTDQNQPDMRLILLKYQYFYGESYHNVQRVIQLFSFYLGKWHFQNSKEDSSRLLIAQEEVAIF